MARIATLPEGERPRRSLPPALARRLHEWNERIGASKYANHALRAVRMGRLVVSGFKNESITLRAASLTYLTLLSIVPTLAVVYAVFKGFGGDLQEQVNAWLFQNIAVGSAETVQQYVQQFATQAHTGAVGGIGFAVLLASAVSLLWNIESAFNAIWAVRQQRRLVLRFLIYWCVLTLGPVLLAVSLTATATLQSAKLLDTIPLGRAALGLAPLLITYFAFALLYFVVPNARVKKRSALLGAFVAGSTWEIAKLLYAVYATRAFKANAFYGSLAAIPVFMLWIYFSWVIVLAGARLVYAIDASVEAETVTPTLSALEREHWLARVACAVAAAFRDGKPPPTSEQIAHTMATPHTLIEDVSQTLLEAQLLRETEGGGLIPARPLEQITLRDVHLAALATGGSDKIHPPQEPVPDLETVLREAEQTAEGKLATHTLASLISPRAKGP